jgi:DNA-binding NarL/FixJ family response regulator
MTRLDEQNCSEPIPTELQHMILRAMMAGQTIATVARTCKIGERTVYRHLAELAKHVGATSRAQLLVEATRRRWLDPASGARNGIADGKPRPDPYR